MARNRMAAETTMLPVRSWVRDRCHQTANQATAERASPATTHGEPGVRSHSVATSTAARASQLRARTRHRDSVCISPQVTPALFFFAMKKVPRLGCSGPVILVLALSALPLSAQDQGVLLLRAGEREVGSETFTIRSDSSFRITARTVFGTRNGIEMSATVDRGVSGELGFQIDRIGGQIYAVQQRNPNTIRRVAKGAAR